MWCQPLKKILSITETIMEEVKDEGKQSTQGDSTSQSDADTPTKDNKGSDGAGKPEKGGDDDKSKEGKSKDSPDGIPKKPSKEEVAYRSKPKYVSLDKHLKMKKQRDEARTKLEKKKAKEETENLKIDEKEFGDLADKIGVEPNNLSEFANLIYKKGVKTASKIMQDKYGSKLKEMEVEEHNKKQKKAFDNELDKYLLPALSSKEKKFVKGHKDEIFELAFDNDHLEWPIYNLYKAVRKKYPDGTSPMDSPGGKKKKTSPGGKSLLNMSDEEFEELDKQTFKGGKMDIRKG